MLSVGDSWLVASLCNRRQVTAAGSSGHFMFLPEFALLMWVFARQACSDPPGFDRAAFHRELNEQVVTFLKAKLTN